MRRTLLGVVLTGFVLVVALGCRHGPIVDLADAKIPAVAGEARTLDEVTKGIVSAGKNLGWSMKIENPGNISGQLWLRGKMLAVDIPYTTSTYSILYKDSANLDYNPESKIGHTNISGWMRNLHLAIQREFARAQLTY